MAKNKDTEKGFVETVETIAEDAGETLEELKSEEGKVALAGADPVEVAEKKIAAMLEKATKTAKEIIDNATKEAMNIAGNKTVASAGTSEVSNSDLEELVTVQLFKDSDKYKDDVFVAVNGEALLIQRGKPVRIKKKFALALEQSMRQDEYTASYSEGLQDEFKEREAAGKL
jgi:hypothetical protein